jgi:hypothetical protein
MSVPPEQFPHIRWRRLPATAPRRTHSNPGGVRIPLRDDPAGHGQSLVYQAEQTLSSGAAARQAVGIDPARLFVLRMTFLQAEERAYLERLRLQIVEEEEVQESVDPPCYTLPLRFSSADLLETFVGRDDLDSLGIASTERERASTGEPDPLRLTVCFSEKSLADSFISNEPIAAQAGFTIRSPHAIRRSKRTIFRLLVQFADQEAVQQFHAELVRYLGGPTSRGSLTAIQRSALFDALETIDPVGPEDRKGERLLSSGAPEGEFYLDVDLWHPGSSEQVGEAIRQFHHIVSESGGQTTDGPATVAQTLLLARVKGTQTTLERLLNYDRVAYVDLPPTLSMEQFTPFDPVAAPISLPPVPDDGPLACVVDSGVVAGHPLLAGVVVDERDFDSGEHSPVDHVGHGTHVAGVVVYGDITRCLQRGEWVPKVRLLSAKESSRNNFPI